MTKEEAIYYLIKPIVTSTIPADETVKQLEAWSMAVKALDGEFEPKHGRWKYVRDYIDHEHRVFECTVCRHELAFHDRFRGLEARSVPYCPNCGAKMDGRENEYRNK